MNNFTRKILKEEIEFSYTNNGKIEILISPHYGAGWSTWNENYKINIALDKRIINYYKKYGNEVPSSSLKEFLESIGYKDVFCGGWKNIIIKTIQKGEKFRIDEYDGWESLITYEKDEIYEL